MHPYFLLTYRQNSGTQSSLLEPFKFFVLLAFAIEVLYILLLVKEIRYNKYTSYFHKKYGYQIRGGFRGGLAIDYGAYYSIKEFDKLDKGKQYWQDRKPEEIQEMNEELRAYEKSFKKKFLMRFQILAVVGFTIIFGISLLL